VTKDDAVDALLTYACLHDRKPSLDRPGAVIERMNADTRAALARLTSDDIAAPPAFKVWYAVEPKRTLASFVDRPGFRLSDFDALLLARRQHLDS
jgi:hypothetical protein